MLEPTLGNVPAAFLAFPGHTGSHTCTGAAAAPLGHSGMRRWDVPGDDPPATPAPLLHAPTICSRGWIPAVYRATGGVWGQDGPLLASFITANCWANEGGKILNVHLVSSWLLEVQGLLAEGRRGGHRWRASIEGTLRLECCSMDCVVTAGRVALKLTARQSWAWTKSTQRAWKRFLRVK